MIAECGCDCDCGRDCDCCWIAAAIPPGIAAEVAAVIAAAAAIAV